jgi:hypothetical protein
MNRPALLRGTNAEGGPRRDKRCGLKALKAPPTDQKMAGGRCFQRENGGSR